MSAFCAEHGNSRKSVDVLRTRAQVEALAPVLEPLTRRPKTSPAKLTDEVKQQAIQVRAALKSSGLDQGPMSVHDKMLAMGVAVVPSIASPALVFRQDGLMLGKNKRLHQSGSATSTNSHWPSR